MVWPQNAPASLHHRPNYFNIQGCGEGGQAEDLYHFNGSKPASYGNYGDGGPCG